MPRKTIEVQKLKEWINIRLASKELAPETRNELAALAKMVLHETDNYQGFNYLDWLEGGVEDWRRDGEPEDNVPYLGDQTRIVFY